jgi:hypothetical protein
MTSWVSIQCLRKPLLLEYLLRFIFVSSGLHSLFCISKCNFALRFPTVLSTNRHTPFGNIIRNIYLHDSGVWRGGWRRESRVQEGEGRSISCKFPKVNSEHFNFHEARHNYQMISVCVYAIKSWIDALRTRIIVDFTGRFQVPGTISRKLYLTRDVERSGWIKSFLNEWN